MLGNNTKGSKVKKTMITESHNIISEGTVISGEITTKGDIRIEGKVFGKITCDSKLFIGDNGSVEGDVDARNAYIAGQVKGTVVVRDLLQLQETGLIEGDIYTSKLSVQVGATFSGNCRMGEDAKTRLNARPDKVEDVIKRESKSGKVNGTPTASDPQAGNVKKRAVVGQ